MFEHKGHKITVGDNGEFRAFLNGAFVEKSSLSLLKKAINKASEFEPFDCFAPQRYGREMLPARVVGIAKARGKKTWSNKDKWRLSDGREVQQVVRANDQNKALIARHVELESERNARRKEVDEKYGPLISAASEAIPYVEAE